MALTNANERLTLAPMAKEELIYTRISTALKNRLMIAAHDRGEAAAVIVRDALNEYFARRSRAELREDPAPYAVNSPTRSRPERLDAVAGVSALSDVQARRARRRPVRKGKSKGSSAPRRKGRPPHPTISDP